MRRATLSGIHGRAMTPESAPSAVYTPTRAPCAGGARIMSVSSGVFDNGSIRGSLRQLGREGSHLDHDCAARSRHAKQLDIFHRAERKDELALLGAALGGCAALGELVGESIDLAQRANEIATCPPGELGRRTLGHQL